MFDVLGLGSAVVRGVHDAVSDTVYGALRLSGKALGGVIGGISRFVGGEEERSRVGDSRPGRSAQGAINRLTGDGLEEEENELRIRMALRLPGRDLKVEREQLADAFPEPTGRLVVFVHGLSETEEAWWLGTRADPEADAPSPRTYGARLRDELGFSPLYLRYNTGLHISENGRRLSQMLEELCEEWPLEVTEVALVGHSMGGLVARSACHEAVDADREWVRRTRHVVCLGAPNTGSWLERFVNVGGWALRGLPELRPFADFLELQSAGIKDLRFGDLRDKDWAGHDPDERLRNHGEPLAPVPAIAYHFVSGALTRSERHVVASVFGDIPVRRRSATGRVTPDASQFHLLNHPRAYAHLREWLGLSFDE